MKKRTKKTKTTSTPRKPPVNRKITKEGVATAMASLRRKGVPITTKTLFEALGRKGSLSTLTRFKKELEAENPVLVQNRGVSLENALNFIDGCDRMNLPALEEAMRKRRRRIHISRGFLCLEIHPSPTASAILKHLGAVERLDIGWTLPLTRRSYWKARNHDFVSGIEPTLLKELERIESQNEFRTHDDT